MSSSPLRRVLRLSFLVTSLLLPLANGAQARPWSLNDTAVAQRMEGRGFLGRLFEALAHLFDEDGSRIDPNGVH